MTRKGSTDEWILVRRAAEYELGGGPDSIPEGMYRYAAAALRELGYETDAATLDAIAGTSAELDEASVAWRTRYDGRPLTASEKSDLDLLGSGRLRQSEPGASIGVDGAWYSIADLEQATGADTPVVIVTTPAPTVEIVTGFRDVDERASWLANRKLADGLPLGERHPEGIVSVGEPWMPRVVPLTGCFAGPDCRTAREERVLAWLLQHGDPDGEVTASLRPQTFCTHSRSEIYEAWHSAAASDSAPTVGAVRNELASRLLRAPGWAARHVGWPFGQLTGTYFDRLAVTPVSAEQAKAAARTLAREDTAAMILAQQANHVPSPKTSATPEAAVARPSGLSQLQPPCDQSHGITPRM